MPSTVSSKGESNFKPVDEGSHIARCVTVVNLGMQDGGQWGAKAKHYIGFEVPGIRVEWEKDGVKHEGPAIIGSRYTSSLSPKAYLRQHLESWRGKVFTEKELEGFDLFNLLGVPCMISVTHNQTGDRVYANITAIMGLPPGVICPDQETESLGYDPEDTNAAQVLAKLPEWMQKALDKGEQTEVYVPAPESENPAPVDDDFNDRIPFAFILPAVGLLAGLQAITPIMT